jgi:hypothetical protein
LILHVDFDLVLRLGVADGEAIPNLDLRAILATYPQQRSNVALLVDIPADGVIED